MNDNWETRRVISLLKGIPSELRLLRIAVERLAPHEADEGDEGSDKRVYVF